MNRSQRIALAMRGHAPRNIAVLNAEAALRHARYILHGIPSIVVVTEPPTTYVLLAREKGLPCS